MCLLIRSYPAVKAWQAKKEKRHGKKKTLGILAARLGRAVYHMLRKGEAFDEDRFWQGGTGRSDTGSSSLSRPEEVCRAGD